MLTYNFSYPYQQDISCAYNYPYSTSHYPCSTPSGGNTLVLNLYGSNSCCHNDGNSDIGDQSKCMDELKGAKDNLNKIKKEFNECNNNFNKCKYDLSKCDEEKPDKDNNAGVITSQEITQDHTKIKQCGDFARVYKSEKVVGHQGFNTQDLVKLLHPKMYEHPEIKDNIENGTYGAVNHVFAFSSDVLSTFAVPSDISCEKCESQPEHPACKNNEFKSLCFDSGVTGHGKNYFTKVCPNLISESKEMSDIKAKQVSPLILVNSSGEMIDRDGNNTQEKYSSLKHYLKSDGKIKDCAGDTECEKFAKTMKAVAWETNQAILVKTSDNAEKTSAYSHDNESQDIFLSYPDLV